MKKFRVTLTRKMKAVHEFQVHSAVEAVEAAMYGMAKGYVEWGPCGGFTVNVEEVNDEENPR